MSVNMPFDKGKRYAAAEVIVDVLKTGTEDTILMPRVRCLTAGRRQSDGNQMTQSVTVKRVDSEGI
jgi:hypothetical protein